MFYFLIVVTIINLFYWIWFFSRLAALKQQNGKAEALSLNNRVLAILTVKNEGHNLSKNLQSFLSQNRKDYDLLIIDDNSTDATKELIDEYQKEYTNLKYKQYSYSQGKKKAMHLTLQGMQENYWVFSDGDCMPASDQWLPLMLSGFDNKKNIVLGYGPFYKSKGLLNKFARFECFMTAIQYFSYAARGIPYMGVGRNLAYKRSIFTESNGFNNHLDILSGDDDLFVSQVATKDNIYCQLHPDSFVYSSAPNTWGGFISQKRRHLATSVRYNILHQLLLSTYALSHIAFYVALLFVNPLFGLAIWATRLVLIFLFNSSSFTTLKEKDLILFFPLLDFMIFVYYTFMTIISLMPIKIKWK